MADRTSAELFCTVFEMLAKNPTKENCAQALIWWEKSRNYDFASPQMGCNEALVTLGLARKRRDPEEPDEGEVWFYGPEGADVRY